MKVTTLSLFAIYLSLLGAETKEIRHHQLEKRGEDGSELYYLQNQDIPYTGKAIERSSNGQINLEAVYEEGKRVSWNQWYENQQKSVSASLKDGKRDGLRTFWHENGQKHIEEIFKGGVLDGLRTVWHENGQKHIEEIFKGGVLDGLRTVWHESGQKHIEANYKGGYRDGFRVRWYKNGHKALEYDYKVGLLMSSEVWKPNGEKCLNTTLKDGNGVLVIYNDDGTEKIRATFMDGVMVKD